MVVDLFDDVFIQPNAALSELAKEFEALGFVGRLTREDVVKKIHLGPPSGEGGFRRHGMKTCFSDGWAKQGEQRKRYKQARKSPEDDRTKHEYINAGEQIERKTHVFRYGANKMLTSLPPSFPGWGACGRVGSE